MAHTPRPIPRWIPLLLTAAAGCAEHRAAPPPDTTLPAGAVDEAEIAPFTASGASTTLTRPTLPIADLTVRLDALQRQLRRKERDPAAAEQRLRELCDDWERTRRATEARLRVLKRAVQRGRLAAEARGGVGHTASAQEGRP
jgi:hypothetical protein